MREVQLLDSKIQHYRKLVRINDQPTLTALRNLIAIAEAEKVKRHLDPEGEANPYPPKTHSLAFSIYDFARNRRAYRLFRADMRW